MNVILYYYCDNWKTTKSMTLMGIYKQTNKGINLLASQILKDVKEKQITLDPAAYNSKKTPTKTEIIKTLVNVKPNYFDNYLTNAKIEIETLKG